VCHILELLGRGLQHDLGDLLDRYFWAPSTKSVDEMASSCRQQPDRADLHLQLGLAQLRAFQVDEAIEHLAEACRLCPDDLAARLAIASAYEEKGDAPRALEAVKIANQIRPGEVPILFAIGFCLEKLRQTPQAAEYYRDAVERDGSFLPARERLAAADLVLGKVDEAIRQYQAILETCPGQPWIHTALAHLYYRSGCYDRAVNEFENAIALEPENWSLVDEEVEALVAEEQIREAIERLHELIEEQGPFADLHVRLADLYSQTGDDDAAVQYYLGALESEPGYLEGMVKLGTHHLKCGRWEQAAEAFHDAAETGDSLLLNYVGMGVANAAAGRMKDAMNSFELAAAVEPNSTLLLTEMSRLQLKMAAAEEFVRSFHLDPPSTVAQIELDNNDLLQRQIDRHAEQVRREPHHADLRYRYGVLLRSEGRGAEALEQFAAAVELNPAYVQAIIRLGIQQQELGLVDEAVETFHRALEIRPEYVDVHYRLGLLYTDRSQLEEAVRHMEAAAGGAPDNQRIRASLALSLQNMGLMDRTAATWRSLWKVDQAPS